MALTVPISLFIVSLSFLGLLDNPNLLAQRIEITDKEASFSFLIPSNWKVVSRPDNTSIDNKESSSGFPFNTQFPYYEQQNNTILALKLKGISEMDLDKHSYITISVKDLGHITSNIASKNNKTQSESLEVLSQRLDNNLSQLIPTKVITKNSTITLDNQSAFQIRYEPLGCFCQEVNTVTIHNGKLFDIFLHAGEFMVARALVGLENITSSIRFLN
ncbi:hypothetical protein YTPLAS21_17460 [Candidatus Nitrosocosmicus sp.]|nr:hypothetical protein YTPLAS21_17460 [Candidatus Nitrosocosmicus sp.]